MRTLERSYNVEIAIADNSLLPLRFYGDFLRQEQTLGEVLDALAATGKIRYEQKGKNVKLYPPYTLPILITHSINHNCLTFKTINQ